MNFVEELRWRGMLQDIMPGTEELLSKEQVTAYLGIDPTADSLHIGHLCGVMILRHFQRCGHKPLALIGGATGMIGDPSGKSAERNLLDEETLRHNQACIKNQLAKFLDFESDVPNRAELVNNYDWMKDFTFLDFVREVGKHITVNYMMAKDSVKRRLNGEARDGLSFTEFTYQLLQGYDFLHLYETKGCKLQMGGSDQWGNITTGAELIRRTNGGEVFALTCPLITKADGGKFGKTESGNIWLDPRYTSPYKFYQFWLNVSDSDAERYIKIFTSIEKEEIEALILDTPEKVTLQSHTNVGRIERYEHAKEDYIQHILESVPTRFDGMKIALDCANGSASATAETLFTALGAEVCMLSAEPDGTNINDHCGSTHMEQLMAYVPAHGCQLGLAFDGDADRCLAVDETGKVVDGDQMIAICAKALKASGKLEKDTAVVTVMTNLGFFHFTKREGIHAVATKVGDRYVLEEMKKGGYCIGGEQSGHIIFLEHATTGDGELSGAKLVEIVKQSGKKLSELAGEMETFPQQMQNVRITADQRNRWKEDEAVCSVMKQYEERLGEDGRILVRESGTEPLIRVMVEAKDADLMQEAVSAIAEELERYTKR